MTVVQKVNFGNNKLVAVGSSNFDDKNELFKEADLA